MAVTSRHQPRTDRGGEGAGDVRLWTVARARNSRANVVTMPLLLARIARRQHGVFSTGQALAAGMTIAQIRTKLRRGDWRRVARDVFAVAGAPKSDLARLWVVWLSVGPPMWFTGTAAALLWELGPLPRLSWLDVAVPAAREAAGRPDVRLRRCREPRAPSWRAGLPVLAVPDVLLDCAASSSDPATMSLVQETLRQRRCSELDIGAAMGRGRSGSARMRRVLAVVGDGADSHWERRLADLCRAAGLPSPTRPTLMAPSGRRLRPDLYWPGLVVEVDGWSSHRGSVAFLEDRRRQNELVLELELQVLRYTPVDIRDRPDDVVAQIRRALARLAS